MADKRIRVFLDAVTGDYNKKMAEAAGATALVGGAAEKLQKPIRMAGAALTAAGATSGIALKGIASAGGAYQSSMNQVLAVTGATESQFTALSNQARELGASTKFSAGESADAMYFLSSAGFSVNEVMSAMPSVLQLAAAGNMDIATTADIASNVLSGYAMEVSQLGHVNDVLAVTFTNTNTNIAQVGEAMKYVAPVASAAGVQFEEAAAAVGLLGNAGIQGSMAGTTLRGIITALISPTGEAADILERLGINALDSSGNMIPLADIIDQLAVSGATTADMMDVFGQRAGPGMAALVSQGADALRNQTAAGINSAGTAAEIAEIQMQGFEGALTQLRSAWEGLKIALFEAGIDTWAERVVKAFTRVVSTLANLPDWMHKVAAFALVATATVGTLAGAIMALAAPIIATKVAVWGLNAALAATGSKTLILTPIGYLKLALIKLSTALKAIRTQALLATVGMQGMGKGAIAARVAMNLATASARALGGALKALLLHPVFLAVAALTVGWQLFTREQDRAKEASERFFKTWEKNQDLESLDGIKSAIRDLDAMEESLLKFEGSNWVPWHTREWTEGAAKLEDTRQKQERLNDLLSDAEAIIGGLNAEMQDYVRAVGVDGLRATEEYGLALSRGATEAEALGYAIRYAERDMQSLSDETGLSVRRLVDMGVTADMTADEVLELAKATAEAREELESLVALLSGSWSVAMGVVDSSLSRYREKLNETNEETRAWAQDQASKVKDGSKSWEDFYEETSVHLDHYGDALDESTDELDKVLGAQARLRSEHGDSIVAYWNNLYNTEPELAWAIYDKLLEGDTTYYEKHRQMRRNMYQVIIGDLQAHGIEVVDQHGNYTDEAIEIISQQTGDHEAIVRASLSRVAGYTDVGLGTIASIYSQQGAQARINMLRELGLGEAEIVRIMNSWARAVAAGMNAVIKQVGGRTIVFTDQQVRPIGTPQGNAVPFRADGGIDDLPYQATIQGPGTLVQWAEPETGGEAFIPLHPAKRARSLEIWEETGRRLGAPLDPHTLHYADGGFRSPQSVPAVPEMLLGYGGMGRATRDAIDYTRRQAVAWLEENLAPSIDGGRNGIWPQLWAAIRNRFSFARLTSAFRPGAITATGRPSLHGLGRAIDIAGATRMNHPQMLQMANWIAQNYSARELIYSRGPSRINGRPWTPTGITRANHFDHVHWAMANGGFGNIPFGSYDKGGFLPTGVSIAHNGTGKPEPVGHGLGISKRDLVAALKQTPNKTVKQTFNVDPSRESLVEARHQARIALMEVR